MATITDLEKQAQTMFTKVKERRNNHMEGILTYVPVDPDVTLWAELDASRYRTMFECSECKKSFLICRHNPFLNGTIKRVYRDVITPTDGKEISVTVGKRRSTVKLTDSAIDEALTLCNAGESVEMVAKKLNANPNELSKELKKVGFIPRKGRRPGTPGGKERFTILVTPEITTTAIARYTQGESMVAIAKDMNVIPNELSQAMKNAGCVITRGKRK